VTQFVIDASVAVKWLFPDEDQEPNVAQALRLLEDMRERRIEVLQPPHWLAEVLAVASRIDPVVAGEATGLLYAMELRVRDTPEMYSVAVELAVSLPHHLFDTLYHAVALSDPEAVLVTADEAYFRKARERGRIGLLRDYSA
jgi:predicted nucleic acid-binding protein